MNNIFKDRGSLIYGSRSNRMPGVLESNRVLRNTYLLLGLTILFSAATAWFSVTNKIFVSPTMSMLTVFGLLWAIHAFQNSGIAILLTFAFTGTLGLTLSPILTLALGLPHGTQVIATAFGLTGLTFLGLSCYALTTRSNFNFLYSFLSVLTLVVIAATVLTLFFPTYFGFFLINSLFVLTSSGYILFHTSRLIHGGETNYILATVSIYISLYNLFTSLLNLLLIFSSGNRK